MVRTRVAGHSQTTEQNMTVRGIPLISGGIQCPWVPQSAGSAKGKGRGSETPGSQDHILMLAQKPGFVVAASEVDETHF